MKTAIIRAVLGLSTVLILGCPDGPSTSNTAPALRQTCSGDELPRNDVSQFGVFVKLANRCGDIAFYWAVDLGEAKGCASADGYTVVGRLCYFDVEYDQNPSVVQQNVVAESSSDAEECVRNSTCSNCTISTVYDGGCTQQ